MGPSYSERRRQALREEIVDAAFDIFAERGFAQAGVADIAERVGIGNSTFYRQFESKQEILEQVIDNTIARLRASLTAENAPGAARTLEEYRAQVARISLAIGDVTRDRRVVRLLLIQSLSPGAEVGNQIFGMVESFVEFASRYIEYGKAAGYLHADLDSVATARAVVGLTIGTSYLGLSPTSDREVIRSTAAAAVDLIFRGVAAA
ncbi:TetR/AcrR family transcriptional regulator [Smaragdicoccus niigatensis]|uniref:TetR/AcrR family transcriptional regulator n=1 Tax=Smaragdicoccus niigatensis TaxID=359359 RepID=UPI00035C29B3|nr:TetR/AcrR family transcriptional regulator [Smaragdicoccus niigatensis]